jgi:hypothetical protein
MEPLMRTRRQSSLIILAPSFALASALAASAWADPINARGSIESVTVYRGQALVTRPLDLAQAAGLAEVVVTDLPPRVLAGSLYAEGGGGVQIRSVQFRTKPVAQDVREDVRKIDAEILGLGDRLAEINAGVQRLAEQRAYLDKVENFIAPTAQVEMSKGVLDADTLTKLADYSFKQREALSKQALDLAKQTRDVQAALEQKQREREKLTAGSARTVNEAVVFLNKEGAGAGTLRLRYLVDSATWTPSYNARGDAKAGGVTLEYFASVSQMSGEDWEGVRVELSTATPAMIAKGPDLTPMLVSLVSPGDPSAAGAIPGGTGGGPGTWTIGGVRRSFWCASGATPRGPWSGKCRWALSSSTRRSTTWPGRIRSWTCSRPSASAVASPRPSPCSRSRKGSA